MAPIPDKRSAIALHNCLYKLLGIRAMAPIPNTLDTYAGPISFGYKILGICGYQAQFPKEFM